MDFDCIRGRCPNNIAFPCKFQPKRNRKRRKIRNIAKEAMKLRHTKKLVAEVEEAWVVVEQVMTMIKKSGARKNIKSMIRSGLKKGENKRKKRRKREIKRIKTLSLQ